MGKIKLDSLNDNLKPELEEYLSNQIKSIIPFKQDYYNLKNSKFFIVEGKLDKVFFEKIFDKSNNLIAVEDLSKSASAFKRNYKISNSKIEIKKLVIFTNLPFLEKNNVYGIVDKDFDEEFPTRLNSRVFSNNTHDLETMLVASDSKLLATIFPFDAKRISKAMFMAYQIAIVKEFISKRISNSPSVTVGDYNFWKDCFDNEAIFNIEKFIKKYNPEIIKLEEKNTFYNFAVDFYNNINSQNEKSKQLNPAPMMNLLKNKTLTHFQNNMPQNFYELVNGHDLMNCLILNYEDNQQVMQFKNSISYKLINCYNLENFKETVLYSKLKNNKII